MPQKYVFSWIKQTKYSFFYIQHKNIFVKHINLLIFLCLSFHVKITISQFVCLLIYLPVVLRLPVRLAPAYATRTFANLPIISYICTQN